MSGRGRAGGVTLMLVLSTGVRGRFGRPCRGRGGMSGTIRVVSKHGVVSSGRRTGTRSHRDGRARRHQRQHVRENEFEARGGEGLREGACRQNAAAKNDRVARGARYWCATSRNGNDTNRVGSADREHDPKRLPGSQTETPPSRHVATTSQHPSTTSTTIREVCIFATFDSRRIPPLQRAQPPDLAGLLHVHACIDVPGFRRVQ